MRGGDSLDHSGEGRLLERQEQMTAPPGDRGQLDFLQHVQRIFDEGEFVATYKFALLIALVELAIERGDDTGAPLELDLHSIAEKFIEQYWPHAAPYGTAEGAPAVLVQNHGRQAAIVARIAEARGRFGSLARAKSDRSWRGFVGGIAQIVKEMPLWKLQTLRRRNVPFLGIGVRARFVTRGMDGAAVLHYHPTYDKDRHDGFRPARPGAGRCARAPLRANRRHAQPRGAAEHGAVPRRAVRPDAGRTRRGAAAARRETPFAPGAPFPPAALPGLRA